MIYETLLQNLATHRRFRERMGTIQTFHFLQTQQGRTTTHLQLAVKVRPTATPSALQRLQLTQSIVMDLQPAQ
jgi:hypothetical protein